MKLLFSSILVFVLFGACSKKDLEKWTKRGCDLSEQADVYFNGKKEISRSVIKKTYYANGAAKSLSVRDVSASNVYDSIYCTFDYQKNAAVAHLTFITRFTDGLNPERISNYEIPVTFDPVTGYATKVGDDVVVYENKKVKSFGNLKFGYDNLGNLVSIYKFYGSDPNAFSGEKYTYDLNNKSGKNEVYTPQTLATGGYTIVSLTAALAEMMRWLPTQSPNRRIRRERVDGDYAVDAENYSAHQYKNGNLVSFSTGASRRENTWKCY